MKKTQSPKDPSRLPSTPIAPVTKDTNWGKTLTNSELVKLIKKLDAKRKEREMSKLSDTLAKALAKKQGKHHPDADDAPVVEKKTKIKPAAPQGKKPPTRSAGRGR